jgi:flagellar basal-body rod protein FlgF
MIRGLWTSAGAMGPAMRAQEILANNMANAATGGFRQDRLAFHREVASGAAASAPSGAPGEPGSSASPTLVQKVDTSAAALETTGDRYHLAVTGSGFFTVQGPDGELYTRDGSLRIGEDGTLLHRSGYPILTEGGTITVPPSADFVVNPDGTVLVNGSPAGKLRLTTLSDPQALSHAGAGLVRSDTPGETDTSSRVLQGSLEGANVDPIGTMVEMMSLLRGFEANQRAITAQDGSLGKLIQWAAGS